MAKFEDPLEVLYLDGRNWQLVEGFDYDTNIALPHGTHISIPDGFQTDFASIPQIFWNILPPTGKYGKAAVVHDYLYRTPGQATRGQADSVLMEAMTVLRVNWATRHTIYWGVRAGGHWSYKGGL